MSSITPITTTADLAASNSLVDLAARINTEHAAATAFMRKGLERAICAGELLIEAKAQLEHGQWLPWLREHCRVPERTANHYMRLARHAPELTENGNVADLTVTEALARIAKPTVAEAITAPEPGPEGKLNADPWLELVLRFQFELAAIDSRIELLPMGLKLPDDLSFEKWKLVGALLQAFFGPILRAQEYRDGAR